MDTITITFPQVKINLSLKDITFDTLGMIEKMIKRPKDAKEKEGLRELYHYISENRSGINAIRRVEDKDIRKRIRHTGAVEPNIDKAISHRFKKRGMSWSVQGALSLLKIRQTIINGEWAAWRHDKRGQKIEIRQEPLRALTSKNFWKVQKNTVSLVEADIPALHGRDQNEPWAKVIRELQTIDYYKH